MRTKIFGGGQFLSGEKKWEPWGVVNSGDVRTGKREEQWRRSENREIGSSGEEVRTGGEVRTGRWGWGSGGEEVKTGGRS